MAQGSCPRHTALGLFRTRRTANATAQDWAQAGVGNLGAWNHQRAASPRHSWGLALHYQWATCWAARHGGCGIQAAWEWRMDNYRNGILVSRHRINGTC